MGVRASWRLVHLRYLSHREASDAVGHLLLLNSHARDAMAECFDLWAIATDINLSAPTDINLSLNSASTFTTPRCGLCWAPVKCPEGRKLSVSADAS